MEVTNVLEVDADADAMEQERAKESEAAEETAAADDVAEGEKEDSGYVRAWLVKTPSYEVVHETSNNYIPTNRSSPRAGGRTTMCSL